MSGWTVPGYTETGPLGRGATGRVAAAVHDESGTRVAIKYLSGRLRSDQEFVDRFRIEAGLLAGLTSPHVVRFHQYVETESQAAMVMELVDGVTLRTLLTQSGPMTPEAALAVMRGSLLGLADAHHVGIVHRDYKPANVLIDADGLSKLADFGIADRAGAMMPAAGTPSYMAPEQWEGAPAQPVTDIYATTVTLFECLTGRVPYSAETLFELRAMHRSAPIPLDEVPVELQSLVAHGLAKDVTYRPHDALAFVAELETLAGAVYGPDWERRGRRALAIAVGALAAFFPLALMDGAVGSGAGAGVGVGVGVGVGAAAVGEVGRAGGMASRGVQTKTLIGAVVLATVAVTAAAVALNAAAATPKTVSAAAPGAEMTTSGGDSVSPSSSDSPADVSTTAHVAAAVTTTDPTTHGTGAAIVSNTATATTSHPGTTQPTTTPGQTTSTPSPTLPGITSVSHTPTTTPPPTSATSSQPVQITVVVTAATPASTIYSGSCTPIPRNATTFNVTITVTGTVTKQFAVDYHWQTGNNGESNPSPLSTAIANAGTYAGPQHFEASYLRMLTVRDWAAVDWTDQNGVAHQSNHVPYSITCTS